jgi:hypothetical protein
MLRQNMGVLDRVCRIALGLILLSLILLHPQEPWHYLGFIGLVPLATGLAASCPLYTLFGWSTCQTTPRSTWSWRGYWSRAHGSSDDEFLD